MQLSRVANDPLEKIFVKQLFYQEILETRRDRLGAAGGIVYQSDDRQIRVPLELVYPVPQLSLRRAATVKHHHIDVNMEDNAQCLLGILCEQELTPLVLVDFKCCSVNTHQKYLHEDILISPIRAVKEDYLIVIPIR